MKWPPHDRPPAASEAPGEVQVVVAVERLAPGGDGVGRQQGGGQNDGRTTFVPLAAPGELVEARLVRDKARVAWGELTAVRRTSPLRVIPPCRLFGDCGGCQWQHVELDAQRSAKRAIVARALGLSDVRLLAPAREGQGYRDRARFVVGAGGEIGFHARRSHRVVDVDHCLLLSGEVDQALQAIRAARMSFPARAEIDLQSGREGVIVAVTADELPVMPVPVPVPVPVSGPAPVSSCKALAASLFASCASAGVVGVRVTCGRQTSSHGLVEVNIAADGEPALRIPAGAFAQVGRPGNAALVATVLAEIGPHPGAVLELYAGSGNFTRFLASRASRLVACDADAAAVARGQRDVPGAEWRTRPPREGNDMSDADTVLVDPPREGLDDINLAAAGRAKRRLVYVSCDPQTLGRDSARLATAGMSLVGAVALDLMPHTFHVEVVATFERARP